MMWMKLVEDAGAYGFPFFVCVVVIGNLLRLNVITRTACSKQIVFGLFGYHHYLWLDILLFLFHIITPFLKRHWVYFLKSC